MYTQTYQTLTLEHLMCKSWCGNNVEITDPSGQEHWIAEGVFTWSFGRVSASKTLIQFGSEELIVCISNSLPSSSSNFCDVEGLLQGEAM